ncbi:carbohydrate-binding module family 20 protein [Athelia psychrophila]|uniref:glucan 1,4-alpha-glucosidase n=1 Tax=Athelia psychrophila TaxID=1759441 RepID=A0A167T2D9_9AGAM|nr:carbohydrate-binding module family 20 protein [Fibularhizoctonia sp. CBS 109695]
MQPWYLSTFAVAEQLYDALHTWSALGSLSITATSLQFFQTFQATAAVGTYAASSSTYTTLTGAIQAYADGFVSIAAQYTPSGGGLAEQFGRADGAPLSALDLTWSYASALTAFDARNGTAFKSWGAKGLSAAAGCQTGPGVVAVTFVVDATTVPGENIYLAGSVASLENWSASSALLLSSANYPEWSITVNVPASTAIQYKYLRINNGAVTWESDPNMQITTPAGGKVTTADTWR